MVTALLIAIGLNFDTFSVCIVEGANTKRTPFASPIKVGFIFGISQAILALIGSFLGLGFRLVISSADHWLAFILLGFIGGKMIRESFRTETCPERTTKLNYGKLFLLSVATSIDALIVGITFALIKSSILNNVLTIAVVTFIVSLVGFYGGKSFKKVCKNNTRIIGGVILIGIGMKILIQHLFFQN